MSRRDLDSLRRAYLLVGTARAAAERGAERDPAVTLERIAADLRSAQDELSEFGKLAARALAVGA